MTRLLFATLAWLAMLPWLSALPVHAADAPQAGTAGTAAQDTVKDPQQTTGSDRHQPKRRCIDRNGREFDWPWPNVPATAQCREGPAPK